MTLRGNQKRVIKNGPRKIWRVGPYNPDPHKVGTLCKMQIKPEVNHLQSKCVYPDDLRMCCRAHVVMSFIQHPVLAGE